MYIYLFGRVILFDECWHYACKLIVFNDEVLVICNNKA